MLNEVRSKESFVNLMLHSNLMFYLANLQGSGRDWHVSTKLCSKNHILWKEEFYTALYCTISKCMKMYEIVKYKNYSEYFVHYWILLMCCINNYAYPALIENIPIKLHPFLGLQYLPLSLRFSFPALINIFIIMLSVP